MVAINQHNLVAQLNLGDVGNTAEKGAALETVVQETFCLFEGVGLLYTNATDEAGSLELDIVLYNQAHGAGLPFLPNYIIIECKNWAQPVNCATLRAFTSKLRSMRLKFGLLVAANGITGVAAEHTASHAHLRDEFKMDGVIVLVLTRAEFVALTATEELGALLRQKFGKFIMGMAAF
ncbi:restriction endonuclease [Mesorhizobium sp.]|uniref:restriction endonuclease n=1 Tax=Mesorhizobium sp. TaxID=1871066 RepID=UPI000FE39BFD|nr:restriction endonuclease [Mesorhizobium sp.]RWN98188.1 MAG: hypothetical protein EOS06_24570 [Mesorhizobium sp.]